jgi:hypothetical protein
VTRTLSPLPTRRSTSPVRFLSSLALIDFISSSYFSTIVAPWRCQVNFHAYNQSQALVICLSTVVDSLRSNHHTGRPPRHSIGVFETTKIRFDAGLNGTSPLPCTNILNVGVTLALTSS